RETANREGEAKREKAKKARQANAEKQKRYRENMKAQGYHAVLVWEKPLPPDMTKAQVYIHKSSLGIADQEDTDAGRFIQSLRGEILMKYQSQELPQDVYRDLLALLKPLGDS
ncbi:MAG: hypothetical protein LBR26_05840, partial [Prevotella sp.]|nr:hypothetical protein [Prevotella sp.]